jgi:peptidoglycan/LPS O-acetylase OafA/YrhL
VFGILLNRFFSWRALNSKLTFSLMLFLFIMGEFIFHGILGLYYEDKGVLSLMNALTAVLSIILFSKLLSKQQPIKLLALIGSSSMSIYLMHILLGSGMRIVLQSIFGIHNVPVHLILGCINGMVIPIICLYYIKKFNVPYVFSFPISSVLSVSSDRK